MAALLLALHALPAAAQVTLRCGVPVASEVAAGESDAYLFRAADGDGVALEAVEISGAAGEAGTVQIRVTDPAGEVVDDFCGFGLELVGLAGGVYRVEIAPCAGASRALYAITLHGITATLEGAPSCGTPLTCGEPVRERTVPDQDPGPAAAYGGVDAYVFEIASRQRVAISVTDVSASLGLMEMRLYDAGGSLLEDTCDGLIERRLRPGRYTLLVNDCFGADVGRYRVASVPAECPPPANDECEAAAPAVTPFRTGVRTEAATAGSGDPVPACTGQPVKRTLWYRITAAADGVLRADTAGSDFDTVLALYRGDCTALEAVPDGCSDDAGSSLLSRLEVPVRAGETYLLLAGSFDAGAGMLVAGVDLIPAAATPTPTPTPAPAGDCCAAHEGRGCVVAPCQSCVCEQDGFCCGEAWDESCAELALSECAAVCMCTVPHTPTPTATPGGCAGDCDGDGAVSVNELVRAVRIALGAESVAACATADVDGDGNVSVGELVQAVRASLAGCS